MDFLLSKELWAIILVIYVVNVVLELIRATPSHAAGFIADLTA